MELGAMVSLGEYMDVNNLNVPRLEHDYYFLRPEDYGIWRSYARQMAVDIPVKREDARTVASLIDQYPDPELDMITGRQNLDDLRKYLPNVKTLTAMAEEHEHGIGGYIRVQALTSAEYSRAYRLASEKYNADWFVIAFGMHTPRLLTDSSDEGITAVAVEQVGNWSPVNVRLVARKISRMTVHPGDTSKRNESDAFRDFFGPVG